jgi:fatty acid CoA ligase FadD9
MSTHARQARLQHRTSHLYATDQQFADAQPNDRITGAIESFDLRLSQIVQTVIDGYADRPALGERRVQFIADASTGRTLAQLLPYFDTSSDWLKDYRTRTRLSRHRSRRGPGRTPVHSE